MTIPDFSKVGRNVIHCAAIWRVRISHNMPVLTDHNRLRFQLLTFAELHPDSKMGRFIRHSLYEDPHFFDELDTLTSLATIERDNRQMEKEGFFMKEKNQPKLGVLT